MEKNAENGTDFVEDVKTGFGIAGGFTLFNVALLAVAAVVGMALSKTNKSE